jgi:hypothetical protein
VEKIPDEKLTPGVGFHLQPDGSWVAEKIPPEVIENAIFSGYLTIEGYRSTVFNSDNDSWAQKSTGTSAIASRVASRFTTAKKDDLVSQVNDIFADEREDDEYNAAIEKYCDTAFVALEGLNDRVRECLEEFGLVAEALGECENEKVARLFSSQMKTALFEAAKAVKAAGDDSIVEIVQDLKRLKEDATRRSKELYLSRSFSSLLLPVF